MTWREFKEWIDKQLTDKQIDEETPIWFIDVSFPDAERIDETGSVWRDKSNGIAVSD